MAENFLPHDPGIGGTNPATPAAARQRARTVRSVPKTHPFPDPEQYFTFFLSFEGQAFTPNLLEC